MPLFYFHLWCGGTYIADREGAEYPDICAARIEALKGARCILSGDIRSGLFNLDQRFEITDPAGSHLLDVPFSEAVEIVGDSASMLQPPTRLARG
jgi:hypothetical protein